MEEEWKSEYFEDLRRNFPEHLVPEYKRRLLTIDDMRDIIKRKNERYKTSIATDLKFNPDTGLYYTAYNFDRAQDLLCDHYWAELLFSNKDKVDWKYMTDCYDYNILAKIFHLLTTPLVWVPIHDLNKMFVVDGVDDVAAEVDPPGELYFGDGRYGFYDEMRRNGLLWFADTMPTKNDIYDDYKYDEYPSQMLLWDRLLFGGFYDFKSTMEFIGDNRGYTKAIEIIDKLREEWQFFAKVKSMSWLLKDHKKQDLEKEIFGDLEPYLYYWRKDAEAEQEKALNQAQTQKGRKETSLFKDEDIEEREKQHFLKFLKDRKLLSNEVDASSKNDINKIAVCFYRCWKEDGCLSANAGGTSLFRFMKSCNLKITALAEAVSNELNAKIRADKFDTVWQNSIRAYLSE